LKQSSTVKPGILGFKNSQVPRLTGYSRNRVATTTVVVTPVFSRYDHDWPAFITVTLVN